MAFDGSGDCMKLTVNDRVSSLTNWGSRCNVAVFENEYQGGAHLTFSYRNAGGYYQDPYLTNGGPGSSANWNNRISSHDFCY